MKALDMRIFRKVFFLLVLFFLLFSNDNITGQEKQDENSNNPLIDILNPIEKPLLSEIIPRVTELSNRLITIDNNIENLVDVKAIAKDYAEVEVFLKEISNELNVVNKGGKKSINNLNKLRHQLSQENLLFSNVNTPLTVAIQQVDKLRGQWTAEREKWKKWELLFNEEDAPLQVKQSFKEANSIIKKALNRIVKELNILLELQEKGYRNQSLMNLLETKITSSLQEVRSNALTNGSTPMYSTKFYEDFDGKMHLKISKGFSDIMYPNETFLMRFWWVVVLQLFVTISVILLIKNNRELLLKSEKYQFLSQRAFSAGIFFGTILALLIYLAYDTSQLLNIILVILGAVSFCFLISATMLARWKKHLIYALNIFLIITGLFNLINLPIPLFRLFITGVTIFSLYKIFKWVRVDGYNRLSKKVMWIVYPISFYLFVILVSEVLGKEILALFMYESLLSTVVAIVFIYVFLEMIKAGIEGIFILLTKRSLNPSFDNLEKGVERVSLMINVIIIAFFFVPRLLVIWEIHDSMEAASDAFFSIGFNVGEVKITLGVLLSSLGVLYSSFVLSILVEMLIMNDTFEKQDLDVGTRLSIAKLIRYFLVFFGFLLALTVLGFDLTNFAIVLSALGVGIGFGLQGVVNNFVSGLILLFERPIREGDSIQIGETYSDIKKIGLRSTRVITVDQADLIIPNSELVYNQVTNWTLSNRRAQIIIEVGVAYGSDVAKVMKTLKEIALDNKSLFKTHKPNVLFRGFGDSTLDFELRIWAKEANNRLTVKSDLLQEIDKRFRENNIEISFPQRDLHIRSVDPNISLRNITEK